MSFENFEPTSPLPNSNPELNAVEHFQATNERQTDRSKETAREVLNLQADRIREKLVDVDRKEENEYKITGQRVKLGVIDEVKALAEKEEIRKRYEFERSTLQRDLDREVSMADLRLGQANFSEKIDSAGREFGHRFNEEFKDMTDFMSGK